MSGDSKPRREATLEIINRLGLHARAASVLVETLRPFDVQVAVSKDGERINGKSIMGLMMLAAGKGTRIHVEVTGPDADPAMEALKALIADKFREDD